MGCCCKIGVAVKILLYKMLCVKRDSNESNNNNNINNYNNTTQPPNSESPLPSSSSNIDNDNNTPQPPNSESLLPSFSSTTDIAESSNSLSFPSVEYEVFLSFRGPDTRELFTDVLYRFLIHSKIRTFKDDNDLRKGEGIWSNLVKAIDQSKIYVPIISESYAHSKWCLKELAEIVERQKEDKRRIILPIFYMVNPNDIRHLTGPYEGAFEKYANHFDEKTIQSWKDALTFVGNLNGEHVKSDSMVGVKIDKVYKDVWSHLSKDNRILHIDELVGINDHIRVVKEQLNLNSNEGVTMVGIHGLGGIGKTTIAKAVYNDISSRFDRCCILEGIRAKQEKMDGNVILQKKLICDVLRKDSVDISDEYQGRKMIKERVSQHKVLIILDDVDENFIFEDLLGWPTDFVSGSKFIITSRNTRVLSNLNDNRCELYEVEAMDHPQSLELFSKHAFKKSFPPLDYNELSNKIVATTGGLPLTLKVIGSLLFRHDISIWKEKLVQLKEIPEFKVMECLKISYDTLPDEAQEIFLDIACFFVGTNKELPCYMWRDCNYFPVCSINILIERSLLKVRDDDEFRMHDQLRDMGREIVRRENIKHPEKRSRIWSDKDAVQLLSNKKEPNQVKAIRVNSSSIVVEELKSDYFKNLSELRYFDAESTKLTGDFNNLLPELRWLRLPNHRDAPMANFQMKSLVILELQNFVNNKWDGFHHIEMAEKLKVLNLAYSRSLAKIPAFPVSGSLEILDLTYVVQHIQGSHVLELGKLRNLIVLILKRCTASRISGGTIGMMKGLRELDLSFFNFECENLRETLSDIGRLSSLKILRQMGHSSREFKDTNPQEKLLEGIKLPLSLKELETSFPVPNLVEMLQLEKLTFWKSEHGFDIPDPSSSLRYKVSKLKFLSLSNTKINTCSPSSLLPSSLTDLRISECLVLDWLPNLENMENLTQLYIIHSCVRGEIQGLRGLKSLKSLHITNVQGLTRIHGLEVLAMTSLEKLLIYSRTSLQLDIGFLLPRLSNFSRLRILELGGVIDSSTDHDQVLALPSVKELATLRMCNLKSIKKLIFQSMMPKLESLSLEQMPNMKEIEGLAELKSLKKITLGRCESLAKFELSGLHNLEEVCIYEGCRGLERLPSSSLANLVKLQRLKLKYLPSLREIAGIEGFKCLKKLDLEGCKALERFPVDQMIDHLKELRSVNIVGCTNLTVDQIVALTTPPKGFEVHGPGLHDWYNQGDADEYSESLSYIELSLQ